MGSRGTWFLAIGCSAALVAAASPLAFGAGQRATQSGSPGDALAGKQVFIDFCGKCHTFAAAGSHGTLGPDLDQDRVSFTEVVSAIEEGVGGIQAEYVLRYITFTQIYNVAKFVSTERADKNATGSEGSP